MTFNQIMLLIVALPVSALILAVTACIIKTNVVEK